MLWYCKSSVATLLWNIDSSCIFNLFLLIDIIWNFNMTSGAKSYFTGYHKFVFFSVFLNSTFHLLFICLTSIIRCPIIRCTLWFYRHLNYIWKLVKLMDKTCLITYSRECQGAVEREHFSFEFMPTFRPFIGNHMYLNMCLCRNCYNDCWFTYYMYNLTM